MTDAQDVRDPLVQDVRDDGFGAHAVHVRTRTGTAAYAWGPDVRRDVHSIAKGVCVLAVGMACDEGLFDVDAPVGDFLPDVALGSGVDAVTTRHLLTMTSGIDLPWSATLMTDWPDLAREFLGRPPLGGSGGSATTRAPNENGDPRGARWSPLTSRMDGG